VLSTHRPQIMAIFITPLSDRNNMTAGEQRFAQMLKCCLSDEYLVWYDVPVGDSRRGDSHRHPDFIVMHPNHGIIVVEVKDWKISTIQALNSQTATLLIDGRSKQTANPLVQARKYSLKIATLLGKDNALIHQTGDRQGSLVTPYNYAVVFSNIKRNVFEKNMFSSVIPPSQVICQDEMTDNVTPEAFSNQFLELRQVKFPSALTTEQIDHIRYHLFPEIRIASPVVDDEIPDIVKVMDLEQEKLARNLGSGHRIIRGVAGSGKTLILIHRCRHLVEKTEKPILVICYNITLARKLHYLLQAESMTDRVIVQHYHGWCTHILQQYRIQRPRWCDYDENTGDYIQALENTVSQAVNNGRIPQGIYGAVLIDEAHDFKADWLQLLAKMPHPDQNHFLVLYDNAQNLYPERHRPVWSRLGIQAKGRTLNLKVNYRNTHQVATWAHQFAHEMFVETAELDEDTSQNLMPQIAGRRGVLPNLKYQPNFEDELGYVVQGLKRLNQEGRPWYEIAVLYASKSQGAITASTFQQQGIPVSWLKGQKERLAFNPEHPSIKLMPIKSSKGLEFPVVCILGIDKMDDYEERVPLLYVGMTRSTDKLVLTHSKQSSILVSSLQAALPDDRQSA
jgi:Nuclease-related domain/UvrD-like helicase C-terminal domain/AAA domain